MDKNKFKLGFIENTSRVFDIPGEMIGGFPRVTVTGNSKVNVENHRGLLEYNNNEIMVNSAVGVVRIKGDKLELSAMSDMDLVALGEVYAVEFIV